MRIKPTASLLLAVLLSTVSFAHNNITDSLQILVNSENPQTQLEGYIGYAEHYAKEDSSKSLEYLSKLVINPSLDGETLDTILKRKTKLLLKFRSANAIEEALKYQSALAELLDSNSIRLINWNRHISDLYFNTYDYPNSLLWIKKSIGVLNGQNSDLLGKLKYKAGVLNYAMGNYYIALDCAFQAIKIFEETRNKNQLALSYMQLGNIHYFLGDRINAEEYYESARDHFLETDDVYGYSSSISNLGLIKIDQTDFEEGVRLEMEALPEFLTSGNEIAIGNTYHYLAQAYLGLESLDSATKYANLSIASNYKTKYYSGLSMDLLIKAKIARKKDQLDSSKEYLKDAQYYLAMQPYPEAEKEILFFLSDMQSLEGNYENSFKNFKRFYAIEDSLRKGDSQLKLLAIKQKEKLEAIQYELQLSKERENAKALKNKEQFRLIIGISIVAALSIIMLIIAMIYLKRNKNLTKELEQQRNTIEGELIIKESLLKEIHHRVKNNLQVVSSMLSLQSQFVRDQEFEKIINDCRGRITSMSLIHESLYKKIGNEQTTFSRYVEELIPRLIETYQVDENKIKLSMDIEPIELNLDESVPSGLIIHEIVSNSLKHAFPDDRTGEISIILTTANNKINLMISDDGVGFQSEVSFNSKESFGFLLIETMANQLEAEFSIENKTGIQYNISWISKEVS